MSAIFHFTAALTLLDTADGGREGPVFAGYRPDLAFDGCALGTCFAQLVKLEREALEPGETQAAEFRVSRQDRPETLQLFIQPGQEFSALEGPRVVARGRVLEVLKIEGMPDTNA